MKKTGENIFLVGPMGAGKTTIGRLLSDTLGLDFIDSDHVIEERTGADIAWIFDVEGEAGFRQREERVIEELTSRQGIVLATGGGAILSPINRKKLKNRGKVVFLSTTVSQQLERTRKDQKRPLLQNLKNPRKRLGELMEVREPLYQEIADITVITGRRSPRVVCLEILKYLQEEKG